MLAADNTTSFPDRALARARSVLFQSPLAQAQGARSYAVYLVHWPVVQAMAYLILPLREWVQYEALAAITAASFVVTALAAHVLHLGVEKPMIRLGARIAGWMGRPRSAPAAALRAGATL
jgi:peptidoglycan/LPS O-acetylase OafA/YrhL